MDASLARREQITELTIGSHRWQRTLGKVILTTVFIALGIAFIIPFYWMVISSIRSPERIFADASKLLPTEVTLISYQNLFSEQNFGHWYLNSMIIAFGFATVAVTLCTLAAYPLARFDFPFRNTIFFTILASQMLPFHLLLIPLFMMMVNFKLIDTYLGVILPLAAHPFGLFYMRQYMLSLSNDVLDAARVDGASEYQVFLQVVLPLVRPAIGTLFILFSLEGWNDLLWPLIVLRSDEKFTLAVGIAGLLGIYRPRWDLVMSAAFLATFPIVILFLFMQKQFVAGISSLGTGIEK
ncbi:MAG TPA: carbohydrate ABC transporter permease [Anaerolineae bacterium]|jgi:ABC-type glycerol-3-phosphate transport system permease component